MEILSTILNLGSEKESEDYEILRMYNMMSFTSFLVCMFFTIFSYFKNYNTDIVGMILLVSFVFLACLIFNANGKLLWTKLCISIIVPFVLSSFTALFGSENGQNLAIAGAIAIAYISFQNQKRLFRLILIYIFLIYTSALILVNYNGPIMPPQQIPYSEIITFYVVMGWLIFIVLFFKQRQVKLVNILKIRNQKLKESSEELERFSYIASHDLKSPLRTIISFIDLLERDLKSKRYDKLDDYLGFIKTGAGQMNFLIEDILELSQLSTIDESTYTWIDLSKVLEKTLVNLGFEIDEKNVEIFTPKDMPEYYGNEIEFLLLFQNFIQNGIKYNTNATPKIWIEWMEEGNAIKISFKDNGIGIEEEYFDTIFQFFQRLHNKDQYQGTGIGLGLCKKIILKYDGEITVSSEIGKGSIFTMILPKQTKRSKEHLSQQALETVR